MGKRRITRSINRMTKNVGETPPVALARESTRSSVSESRLFDILQSGDTVDLKRYITTDGDLKCRMDGGITPLMIACGNGNFAQVKLLLELGGVSITDKDAKGRNCLHHLCLGKKEKRDIYHLIQPRMLVRMRDVEGKTPLEYAIQLQLPLLTKLMMDTENSVDIKLCYDYNTTVPVRPPNANRYGFITDHTDKAAPFTVKELTPKEQARNKKRLVKWQKMLKYLRKGVVHKKFVSRLYKGMPDECRSETWKLLLLKGLDMDQIRSEFKELTKKYTQTPFDKQLDLDVSRTLQFHYMYQVKYGGSQKALFYIFHALFQREKDIEYLQGMTVPTSFLTLFLDEVSAYAGTLQIMNGKYRMKELYNDFKELNKFWNIAATVIQKRHPRLTQVFKRMAEENNNNAPFFVMAWIYQWYTNSFNIELALRIFDVIIYEGLSALFTVADTIFHFTERAILSYKLSDCNQMSQGLKTPFAMLQEPPTNDAFMEYMWKHRVPAEEIGTYGE